MHLSMLIVCVALGLGVALTHVILKLKAGSEAEFFVVIEILLAAIGVAVSIKCAILAWTIDRGSVSTLTEEDRVYFSFGALALFWASVQAIIRKFLK